MWKRAPTAIASPITIRLWIAIVSTDCATLPRLSAPRQIGETSRRSIVPRLMSSMKPMPTQPAVDTASITTIPGVRNSTYEPPVKPGISAAFLNTAPNSSSQTTGWTSEMPTHAGWRSSARM